MPKSLAPAPGVVVPERAFAFRAVRSSGAGGQNVNKVSSKVELHVDLALVEGLDEGGRRRLASLAASRLDAEGRLVVRSQLTRDQSRNLEDAYQKVESLVRQALVAPRPRRATRATAGSRERRLTSKKARAAVKRTRRERVGDE